MNSPQVPDLATRDRSIQNLRQIRREIADFNQELVEIEAQLDRELYAQKLARIGNRLPSQI
jgi:predicted phage-related endonuclease